MPSSLLKAANTALQSRLSAKLKAGLVAGAVDYPVINGHAFEVKKNVFSGKATALCSINSEVGLSRKLILNLAVSSAV